MVLACAQEEARQAEERRKEARDNDSSLYWSFGFRTWEKVLGPSISMYSVFIFVPSCT